MKKYNKNREPASKTSVRRAKELGEVNVHPLLKERVSDSEQMLLGIREHLRSFRPKTNAIEAGFLRSKDLQNVERMRNIARR